MITLGTNYKVTKGMNRHMVYAHDLKYGWKPTTDYLLQVENSVILTREELEKLISDVWDASYRKVSCDTLSLITKGIKADIGIPDKQRYISSVIKQIEP